MHDGRRWRSDTCAAIEGAAVIHVTYVAWEADPVVKSMTGEDKVELEGELMGTREAMELHLTFAAASHRTARMHGRRTHRCDVIPVGSRAETRSRRERECERKQWRDALVCLPSNADSIKLCRSAAVLSSDLVMSS